LEQDDAPAPEPEPRPVTDVGSGEAQVQLPAPTSSAAKPASAAPKRVLSDGEKCTVLLFNLLDSPKRFRTEETYRRWSKQMEDMLAETGVGYTDFAAYLKWAVTENIDKENRPRSSAEWIPNAKDPCQTLCNHSTGDNPWLFGLWQNQRKLAKVRRRSETSGTVAPESTPKLRTMDDLCATMQGAGKDSAITYIREHSEEYKAQHPDWYQHWKEFEIL
jgi:hypothetical protein